jgi:hypothetical protein
MMSHVLKVEYHHDTNSLLCCQLSRVVTLGCWKLRSQVRELCKTKLVGGLEPWNFMTSHI